ncbi:hypothetical protein NHQ30_009266 [Ciborinia camelliae]|nr:hypothetical protein NHQ30_009266 [Ciborinia camelliae]
MAHFTTGDGLQAMEDDILRMELLTEETPLVKLNLLDSFLRDWRQLMRANQLALNLPECQNVVENIHQLHAAVRLEKEKLNEMQRSTRRNLQTPLSRVSANENQEDGVRVGSPISVEPVQPEEEVEDAPAVLLVSVQSQSTTPIQPEEEVEDAPAVLLVPVQSQSTTPIQPEDEVEDQQLLFNQYKMLEML